MTKKEAKIQIALGLFKKYIVWGYRQRYNMRQQKNVATIAIEVWAQRTEGVHLFIQLNMYLLADGIHSANEYLITRVKGTPKYKEGNYIVDFIGDIINEDS